MNYIKKNIKSIEDIIDYIKKLNIDDNIQLAFRGEKKDYKDTQLTPSIYRNNYLKNEDIIYREMQRFNDNEFLDDRTTFDKLSRMQHYSAPTRLLDISEDLMSAIYFAIANKEEKERKNSAILYIFEIDKSKIKYYDSDAVSVISNLAKIPLNNSTQKSKEFILCDTKKYLSNKRKFNKQGSVKFLRHEIREEKPQFEAIINPKDITSIFCVRPKLTSNRLKLQKGFFFLFGLNPENLKEPIKLIEENEGLLDNKLVNHPIKRIHKLIIETSEDMEKTLKKMGITQPFIYPEMDKVAENLKQRLK